VTHDLLGLFERFTPRFVKRYATLANIMRSAFKAYCDEVRAGTFPAEEHTYPIPNEVWQAIEAELDHKS